MRSCRDVWVLLGGAWFFSILEGSGPHETMVGLKVLGFCLGASGLLHVVVVPIVSIVVPFFG